jgi:hypothetical protein
LNAATERDRPTRVCYAGAGGLVRDQQEQEQLLDDVAINPRGHEAGIQRPPRLVRGT